MINLRTAEVFRLAMIQMNVRGGDRRRNLQTAGRMIAEAAGKGAAVLLLPEAMDLGWTHPSAKTESDPIPAGETCRSLIQWAKKFGVYICSGLVEKAADAVFNSAVLISPEGEILLHHRKINELEIGHEFYAQGRRMAVCETEFGNIGLMVCSDAFAEERVISQSLAYMGADIILSPSSWAVPPDHDLVSDPPGKRWLAHYGPVAQKFKIWIAGVSNVGPMSAGPWRGYACIGNSLLVDSEGKIAAEGPCGMDKEAVIYADVQPVQRPARGCGWQKYWKNHP